MLRATGGGTRARGGLVIVLLTVAVCAVGGCSGTVPGTPYAEGEAPVAGGTTTAEAAPPTFGAGPPTAFQEPSGRPTVTVDPEPVPVLPGSPVTPTSEPVVPRPLPDLGAPTSSRPPVVPSTRRTPTLESPGPPAPLTADVIADECLLDGAEFAALLGEQVATPTENAVTRPDGSRTRSCYATGPTGSPTAAVNVYRVNQGTPASFVRAAAGGRPLSGVGEAAVLMETVGGSTLQIATPRFLITVSVVDAGPTEARWIAAGRAAATALTRP